MGILLSRAIRRHQSKLLCEGYVFDDMGEETIEVDPQNQLESIVKLASKRGARITDMIVLHNQIDVDWEACDCAFGYQGIGCMCNDGWQGRVTRFV